MNPAQNTFSLDYEPLPLALCEQPQARLEAFGPSSVSDGELIAMLLQGSGVAPTIAVTLAQRLLSAAGSIAQLAAWHPNQFQAFDGIGPVKALQIVAACERGRRMIQGGFVRPLMNRPELVAEYFRAIVVGLEVEKFWVCCLCRKNRLIKCVELTSGTATATLVHPREVFRAACRESAAAITCVHNHPSGDPAPSAPDMQVTRLLRESAKALDIPLLDHVIIGRPADDIAGRGYFSFREGGLL